jgi:hypothetical protein
VVVRIGPGPDPGWLVAAVGIGMTVVGWYQISGQPTEAQQLPYLASATIPGSALIIAGAVMITARRLADHFSRDTGDRYDTPYDTVGHGPPRGTGPRSTHKPADEQLWALPGGTYSHRADCPLIDGKPEAFEITDQATAPQRACPVCDPDLPAPSAANAPASDTVTSVMKEAKQGECGPESRESDTVMSRPERAERASGGDGTTGAADQMAAEQGESADEVGGSGTVGSGGAEPSGRG